MDKTRNSYRESHFRTPGQVERGLGLWIDRIGAGSSGQAERRLRILGQFAAIGIDEGEGVLRLASGPDRPLVQGDVILLTPGLAASYWPAAGWYTRWIVWNGPEAERLSRLGYLAGHQPVIGGAAVIVNRAFFGLAPLMRQEGREALLQRKTLLLTMILELHQSLDLSQRSHDVASLGRRVEHYLSQHLEEDLGIAELAKRFDLSASQFRRLFKQYSGTSPRDYITSRRVSRAKELLVQGASIKETAATVGYSDVFYFMRLFKQRSGQTAGEFARRNRL